MKQKVTLFIAVTYALKVMTVTVLRRNIIANVQCLLLALKYALKQSCHQLINRLINEALLVADHVSITYAASAHRRPSLVSDKHVPACRFKLMFPGAGAMV